LSIPVGGRILSANLHTASLGQSPRPGLVFVHGLRSEQAGYRERADASARAGITSITFDLGGHGASEGELEHFSLRDHLADLLAVYDTLTSDFRVDASRIGLCGASYGAYLAVRTVLERDVRRLLLRAPALYDDGDFDVPLDRLRSTTDAAAAAGTLGKFAGYGGAVLLIESGQDEVIAHEVVEAYRTAFPRNSYHCMAGATHALIEPAWRREFVELILSWFGAL
jgi:alpha-beta hydrolase superfamily lysophospholipase